MSEQEYQPGFPMSYVRTFLPWIVFAVLPSGQWQWAALAGLVAAVAVTVQQRRAGAGFDALIIEIGSAVFFAALTVIAFVDPHSGVHAYSAALSSATLALIAGVSLLVGKPFTLGIAKRSTPARSGACGRSSGPTSSSPPSGPRPSPSPLARSRPSPTPGTATRRPPRSSRPPGSSSRCSSPSATSPPRRPRPAPDEHPTARRRRLRPGWRRTDRARPARHEPLPGRGDPVCRLTRKRVAGCSAFGDRPCRGREEAPGGPWGFFGLRR